MNLKKTSNDAIVQQPASLTWILSKTSCKIWSYSGLPAKTSASLSNSGESMSMNKKYERAVWKSRSGSGIYVFLIILFGHRNTKKSNPTKSYKNYA